MSIGSPQYEEFTGFTPCSSIGPYRAADYEQLEEGAPYELIRGRLIMSPSPTSLHQVILSCLDRTFAKFEGTSRGLSLIAPMDVVFSEDTILQPDLLYVSEDRKAIVKEHVMGPPNLVVEILSPATGRRDKTEKLDLYAKFGVPEYWIVDPATQHIEFLLLGSEGKYVVEQQPDDQYRSPKLPEIEINLAAFWAEIDRRLPQPKPSS